MLEEELDSVVALELDGQRATVVLRGEVDLAVEQPIVEAIRRTARLEALAAICVDATAVTFIDSSGLRALILGREAALSRGLEFSVRITADGQAARVFALAGLVEALGVTHLAA
jgi:anti-anti-sigma factor